MTLADGLRESLNADHDLEVLAGDVPTLEGEPVEAAVLIAITDRPEPGVILTVRRNDLRTHAGQIAFPGGRLDPGEDAVGAALREAWEEVELDPARATVVGKLTPYRTITNYTVTPIIAVIPPDLPLRPHEREVADWFEAPLAHLVDPANHVLQSRIFQGQQRNYYEIMWGKRRIWGATAAIIVNLARRLQWA